MLLHEQLELLDVHGQIPAEHEDEDVVEHPVIQPVHEERLEYGVVRQPVDEDVEGHREARPVVKGNLHGQQQEQADFARAADHVDPDRHGQVEPDQDDQEVELVFRIAEEQDGQEVQRVRKAHLVEDPVVEQVKERPDEIGDEHGLEPPFQEGPVVKRHRRVKVVKEAEGRDEEKDRHAEARGYLKKGDQVDIRGCVHDVLRPDVDSDDAHHGDAADVLDGREARLALVRDGLRGCLLLHEKRGLLTSLG